MFVVIEDRERPILFHMTALTLVSELAFVAFALVILAVTGHARGLELFLVKNSGVTGAALGETMFSLE